MHLGILGRAPFKESTSACCAAMPLLCLAQRRRLKRYLRTQQDVTAEVVALPNEPAEHVKKYTPHHVGSAHYHYVA